MKLKLLLFSFFLAAGLSSCAYKTCPTYAKKDIQKMEKKEIKEIDARV
ncbi:hypothetical protein [Chondrinema litorale]|nr:hypothetical protein [Chondrinema litorale]UZR95130.1 hypothetical protein OQ292_04775 [Chondrinema litorale]